MTFHQINLGRNTNKCKIGKGHIEQEDEWKSTQVGKINGWRESCKSIVDATGRYNICK